jgi:hypothetical protein
MQLLEQAMKMFERVIEEGKSQHHPVRTFDRKIRRQIQLVNDRRNTWQRRKICGWMVLVDLWVKHVRSASRACDRVPLVGAETLDVDGVIVSGKKQCMRAQKRE